MTQYKILDGKLSKKFHLKIFQSQNFVEFLAALYNCIHRYTIGTCSIQISLLLNVYSSVKISRVKCNFPSGYIHISTLYSLCLGKLFRDNCFEMTDENRF